MTCKNLKRLPVCSVLTVAVCWSLASCGGGGGGSDTAFPPAVASTLPGAPVAALPVPVATAAPDATTSAAPVALPTAPATVTATATAASSGVDGSCGLNSAAGIEAEVMQRINTLRASGAVCGTTAFAGASALVWNNTLVLAAKGHSADMAQKNYFSHTSQDGRTAGQRITAAGYDWSTYGENIAAGQRTVEQVMNGWISSPGHCQNLMNPNFRDVAVACVRNDSAYYRLYWTMELGRSR